MARSRGPVLPPGAQPSHAGAEPVLPAYPHQPHPQHGHPQTSPPPANYGSGERGYDGYSYPSFPPQQYQPPAPHDPRHAGAHDPAHHGYPAAPDAFGSFAQDPRYGAPTYDRGGAQGHRLPHDPGYPPAFDQYAAPNAPPPYPSEPLAYNQPPADPRWAPPAEPSFQDYRRPPAHDRGGHPGSYGEPEPDLRGAQFDQWPQPDPRGYDLGAYAAGQNAGHQQPGFGAPPQDAQRAWPGQGGPYAEPARFEQQIDQNQGALQPYDPDQEEDEEPEEAPRRGRGRGLLIVSALVGAIGLGGGLAYAYKMFLAAPPSNAARVVKAPQQPVKTQPADPGGRKFANSDSKVMDRLPSDGTAGQGDPAGDEQTGARRVQTIPVTRDGALAAPAPAAQPLLPPGGNSIVPGMTIVNGGVRPPMAPPQTEATVQAPPQQQPGRVAVAPLRPQIVAKAEPEPEPEPVPAAPQRRAPVLSAPATAQGAQPKAAVPVRAPAATASVAPAGAGAEPVRKATSFVVVLASQKSRMEALTTFADLQQKYGSVLADKVPDVQEADLSSRNLGTVYRLVVGPAGPREKALAVCNQLKAAGYQGCWVTGS